MKKIIIIFFIYFFQLSFAIANTSLVFLDMEKVLETSIAGSSIISQLNNINSKNLNKFKSDSKKLKYQENKLISQKNILSKAEFQSKINELKLKINSFNKTKNKINNNFNKLKIDNTNKLLKLINPLLINYSNEKSILLILQKRNLIMGKKELDITDEIIKIVNKNIKKFNIK